MAVASKVSKHSVDFCTSDLAWYLLGLFVGLAELFAFSERFLPAVTCDPQLSRRRLLAFCRRGHPFVRGFLQGSCLEANFMECEHQLPRDINFHLL